MIARFWHGVTPLNKADDYLEYIMKTGVKDYQATPGNKGVFVLRRPSGDKGEFLLMTLWESTEAIRKFAGDDIQKARYYPEDTDYLVELEPTVDHYEVVLKTTQE